MPPSIAIIAGGSTVFLNSKLVEAYSENYSKIQLPNLPTAIVGPNLFHHNGTILLCGGQDNFLNSNKRCYQLVGSSWKQHSSINQSRPYASVAIANSCAFLFGGTKNPYTYEYLIQNSTNWEEGKSKIPGGFEIGSAIAISQEEIWLIGGQDTERRILSFNAKNHTFEELSTKLQDNRIRHACALIPGTTNIIITGGAGEKRETLSRIAQPNVS